MKYPHLLKYERKIWKRFLDKYNPSFDSIWYDVHLGRNAYYGFSDLDSQKMWGHLIKKRIDVLFLKDKTYTVCEVKRYASLGAIGQVLSYRELLMRDWFISGDVDCFIITDYALPDISWLCERFKITLFEV